MTEDSIADLLPEGGESAFLRGLLASSDDCVKVLDLDGNLVFMSARGQRVMEVPDFGAIRGCPWPGFWHGQGNTDATAAIATARGGGSARFQGFATTLAGTPRWWDVTVTPILGADGRPEKLLSISRDISAIHHADILLRDAQRLNTLILSSSRDCIVVLDLEGTTLFVSPGGIEAMEISDVSAIIGLSWLRVWKDADNHAARAAVAQAGSGGIGRFQGFCPTHKGTPKWWDVVISALPGPDGAPERLVAIGRDFTEQKHVTDALHDAEARLRLAQEIAGIGTFETFVETDDFVASDQFFRIYGLVPAGRAPTSIITDLVLPEDRNTLSTAAIRRAGMTLASSDYRIRRADTGEVRWIERQADFVAGDEGHPPRLLGIARDVTARKRWELRQAALLELGDMLRDRRETADIVAGAAEILGRALNVARAGYGRVDATGRTVFIERDWCASVASVAGLHDFNDYGTFLLDLLRGDTLRIGDTRQDARTRPGVDRLLALQITALLIVPLMRQGVLVAILFAHDTASRRWTDEETDFALTVADRVWAAMAQADAEAELRRMNEGLEALVTARTRERDQAWKNAQDLQLVLEFSGVIRAVNEAWTAILGWRAEEVVGCQLIGFVHPDDHARTRDSLEMAALAEMPTVENRCRHKDGTYRWFSWVAAPAETLIYASGRHVTEERAAAEALHLAQSRIRSVFETTFQFQGFLDADGIMLDANPASLGAIGCSLADVAGKPLWNTPWFTATPGMARKVKAGIAAARSGQVVREEITINLPDGRRSFDFSMRPVRDPSGKVVAIVPEGMETTERRRAEEALRQSQKMEAVGQLTGGLAHDFNNLLTGMTGSLELMRTRMQQGRIGEVDRYISAAQGAAKRAAALTHRLLAFSRRQTLDPRPTDVNQLVAGMEELIRRTMGPAITTEVVTAVGLWTTLVDPGQLENALLNLCINARDAMQVGGRLTIETTNRWLDEEAALERELPAGQYLSLCVTDTGTGMTSEVVKRAFDPFFTTKPLGDGTGLGLSMVYGFARQSGGQARIYSELGLGTTMCLYLPRSLAGPAVAEASSQQAEVPPAEQGETVLVVDDEATIRMLVAEVLIDLGYTVIEASDGAGAIRVLESDARLDLLVTDVGLSGGINGRQVADAARALRPALKVLFITGYAENAVLGNGTLEPGMEVLTKPFGLKTFANRVQDMIARS